MARGPRISRKKQPTLLDNEEDDEEEGDEWISDLKRFLGQQLVKYLTNKKLKAEDEELLRDIVQKYKEKLDNHVYIKHTNAQAWGKVIEQFRKATQAQQTDFAPDSEVEELPKKRKKSVKAKSTHRLLQVSLYLNHQHEQELSIKYPNGFGLWGSKPKVSTSRESMQSWVIDSDLRIGMLKAQKRQI